MSITELSNELDVKGEESKSVVEEPVEKISSEQGVTASFTQEELSVVWKQFLSSIEDTNVRLFAILSDLSPTIKSGSVIEIGILSSQKAVVENERARIIGFLRDALKSNSPSLSIEVVKQNNTSQKPFTATDKMKLMIEKNPILGELKAKLGLDLD